MDKNINRGAWARVRIFALSLVLFSGTVAAAIEIDQQPLLVAKPVPGNMAIIGSFEFPTMVTRAYKSAYSLSETYIGYFDSGKCYEYKYYDDEAERHFSPINKNGPSCSGDKLWSGHFLNWATMQSIDIFRHILTGGYRFKDEPGETWLEKGVQTGQGGSTNNFPDANVASGLVAAATPFSGSDLKSRIGIAGTPMGNKMRFVLGGSFSNNVVDYIPSESVSLNQTYEVSIRVKVCDASVGLEPNCNQYSAGYKPEGLIQDSSEEMRFAAFGYLNDNSSNSDMRNREGGIMHSRMKYVGHQQVTSDNAVEDNNRKEWNHVTGVFIANPDPTDASNTPGVDNIQHSGVISYINNSGMIVDGTEFKRFDNVSELYYTAYRYIKKLGNVPAYSTRPNGTSDDEWKKMVGGLPIITDWYPDDDDPLQFSCQKTFFLGIGDTNTHKDDEIPKSDDNVKLGDRRSKIHSMEGGGVNVKGAGTGTDYIAALAYDANTTDLRPDLDGKQTVSTYWIDILEDGLKGRKSNAYWLAAKYGGFKVPEGFDPDTRTEKLPESWWHTNGEEPLSSGDPRPDNFYVVDSAQSMADSLTRAFSDIQSEQRGTRSSLALNSTTLETGAATFQVEYTSGAWTGNLNAYSIDATTGAINPTPAWTAADKMPVWSERNIKVGTGTGGASQMVDFKTSTSFTTTFKGFLTSAAGAGADSDKLIDYLRGQRVNENSADGFRVRQGVLGDIVNSQPVYVGAPSRGLYRNRAFNGVDAYEGFATTRSTRTPVIYVGGNDGMLHGFNATVGQENSGKEVFAYIPYTVVENGLGELASQDYEHRYFVDGELTVADAYDGSAWRTVLVGTLGAGGIDAERKATRNAVFALDVTDPANISLLWEMSSGDIPALGINLGKPVIAQVANGKWRALLGNGPNSGDSTANLIAIDLFNGSATTTQLSTATENGLSAVRAWNNAEGFTDTVYAGDLKGNLWKVSGLGGTTSASILFTAAEGQSITSMPLIGRSPYDQTLWLFFGTGRYFNTSDLNDKTLQSWYGIKDVGSTVVIARADLVERKILADIIIEDEKIELARVIEDGAREDLIGKDGWYIDLAVGNEKLGERMITANQFQGRALIGNTRIPDASDPCSPTGRGVVMAIDPFSGGRLPDDYFNFPDRIKNQVMIDGQKVPASGFGLGTGFNNPSFLDEKMYIPTDETGIPDVDIFGVDGASKRTSWRELINTGG